MDAWLQSSKRPSAPPCLASEKAKASSAKNAPGASPLCGVFGPQLSPAPVSKFRSYGRSSARAKRTSLVLTPAASPSAGTVRNIKRRRVRAFPAAVVKCDPTLPTKPARRKKKPRVGTHPGAIEPRSLTFIDAGQKDPGNRVCSKCGMVFSPGIDDARHTAHCASQQGVVAPVRWTSVASGPTLGDPIYVTPRRSTTRRKREVEVCIVEVLPKNGRMPNVARSVWTQMQTDLGSSGRQLAQERMFVAVASRLVVGCVTAHQVQSRHRIVPPTALVAVEAEKAASGGAGGGCGDSVPTSTRSLDPDLVHVRAVKPPVHTLGISCMWVHSHWRRLGIGKHMLGRVAQCALRGCPISPKDVAFSQPTANGRALAEAFTGQPDFRVYFSA